jgi:hypothetical protein
MVLSIIFLEDKHKIVLHLSIFDEYQHFFQHRSHFLVYGDVGKKTKKSTTE